MKISIVLDVFRANVFRSCRFLPLRREECGKIAPKFCGNSWPRLTNWQLLSAERGREQGNGGNGWRMRVGEGGNALLFAACSGKGRKSGRLPSESRLIFGKTSGLSPKSPQVFPH